MKDRHGRIRVEVTADDIALGEQRNSMKCVVALAVKRTISGADRVDVDMQTIRWTANGERFVYLTPYSVQGYVATFDAGEHIHPFSFALHERTRIPVRGRVVTDAGKAVMAANNRVKAARKSYAQTRAAAAEDRETATELERKKTAVEQAEKELVSVKAAYHGQSQVVRPKSSSTARKAPPRRAYKTRKRGFGVRMLRLNQE